MVGHFTDSNWQMVSCILGTCPFSGTHTAVNISEKLLQVIEEYQLGSVTAVVHNQASNMEVVAFLRVIGGLKVWNVQLTAFSCV